MLFILHERLQYYLEGEIPAEQAKFIKEMSTREQIRNIRQLLEEVREFNPLIIYFLDNTKIFDSIR